MSLPVGRRSDEEGCVPPHEEEPMWPSDDSDTTDADSESDGGATAQLPARSGEAKEEPKQVSLADQQTVWAELPKKQPKPDGPAPKPGQQVPQLSAGQTVEVPLPPKQEPPRPPQ